MDDALAFLRESGSGSGSNPLSNPSSPFSPTRPRVLGAAQEAVCLVDERSVVNLASNNYLGLANHPKLKRAAVAAVHSYGAGTAAVRTIAGTMQLHTELEERIAHFKRTEAALLFQSGFTANAGTVAAILGQGDLILSDELNHASIIDGCRLSRAEIRIYPHGDVDALRRLLDETKGVYRRTLVVTDGIFSMDGDIAPLAEIATAVREAGVLLMVDDAHATGVLGDHGRGSVDHFGLNVPGRPPDVHIQVGTLSKAIGVVGGYVAGNRLLVDYLLRRARPILFSTSHPPAVTAACLAAFDLIETEGERIQRLWENARSFRRELQALGFDTGKSQTPIIPVMTGPDETTATKLSQRLFEQGIFCVAIAYPTVPRGKGRVRVIVTSEHTEDHLQQALDAFAHAGKELGLI